ncbi:type III-B CRISPR module RAMP protein Cmr4 [Acidianus sp. HS-5]|uniref:type III-B CRISPR module RAMP protein Cmr4 n=1 Tax=Acidianus sp. HS-5 TaxID=2886040 RepID=UPI001F028FB2|nr:type III-B CRISPR module RAMP protein Cmr4 [Acidianus sp. HS-5]BDC17373.1 type III-B CRISPR module RAMP protein Cmr4 [Acidianus sp. HS-5]
MTYYAFGKPFFINAVTHLHVGSGSSVEEEIDLPFQKDELNYPMIYASSLKGAIKSFLVKEFYNRREVVYKTLGYEENSEEASLGSFLDAVLFAVPARNISVNGLNEAWVYVTTYELLRKVKSYLDIISKLSNQKYTAFENLIDSILNENEKNVTFSKGVNSTILNEDFYVNLEKAKQNDVDISVLNEVLKGNSYGTNGQPKPLIILNDYLGREVINRSLLRVRRIKIENEKKTARIGGLWSEEYVPMNSLFFSVFLAREGKDVADFVNCVLRKTDYVILGGKETIGKGIVRLRWLDDL